MLKRDKILLVIFFLVIVIIFIIIVVAIRNFFSELFEAFLQMVSERSGCEGSEETYLVFASLLLEVT